MGKAAGPGQMQLSSGLHWEDWGGGTRVAAKNPDLPPAR